VALVIARALGGAFARAKVVAGRDATAREMRELGGNEDVVDVPVSRSSFITRVRWTRADGNLDITMQGGRSAPRTYTYPGVGWDDARAFIQAASMGRYYNAEIKMGTAAGVHRHLRSVSRGSRSVMRQLGGGLRRFGASLRRL